MSLDQVTYGTREDGESLPLFVRPTEDKSREFLERWLSNNKEWVEEKLLEHGAVMFRGFDIPTGADFESVVRRIQPELSDQYRGTSPRRLIPGTKAVFSASELPSYYPIAQHLEMSQLPAPPRKVFFCCLDPPTSFGGETSLCDFRKVYKEMDPEVRSTFEEKGVMYIKNYTRNGKKWTIDPTMLKGWEELFDTADKTVVEEECRRSNIDFKWKDNDTLTMVNREEAIQYHPKTNEPVWFNHVQVFHLTMLKDELCRVSCRSRSLFFLILAYLMALINWVAMTFLKHTNFGFYTFYGDGSEVSPSALKEVGNAIWKNMVFNRWEMGDILMIDNFSTSHGRQPYFGKRKVVVSWSPPCPKPKAYSR